MEKEIFCFIQRKEERRLIVVALCECGKVLAIKTSTNSKWAKNDIGMTSEKLHDRYKEHCPDGFKLTWLNRNVIPSLLKDKDSKLAKAYKANQESDAKNII